ncbi:MAG: hypothetical protein M3081_06530, partial [Gemmatimonadota bacterium]|nr:hypothetical protein [Gemmatimonadota bacterium]
MSVRINTNVSAINAGRNLEMTQNAVNASMSKLSSGFRITRAADDAAGLGIANKMRSDIGALTQASNNAAQANSLLQIAEGATNSISQMLDRLKVLATEAGSDTVDASGRSRIQEEYVQISAEIDRTVKSTKFQGSTLLDGTFANFVDGGTPGAGLSVADVNGNVTVSGAHSLLLNAKVGYTDTPGAAGKNTLADLQISGTTAGTYTLTETQSGGAGTVYDRMTLTDGGGNTQTVAFGAGGAQQINFSQFGITLNTSAAFTNTSAGGTMYAVGNNTVVVGGTNKGQFLVGSSGSYGTSGNDYIAFKNLNISS